MKTLEEQQYLFALATMLLKSSVVLSAKPDDSSTPDHIAVTVWNGTFEVPYDVGAARDPANKYWVYEVRSTVNNSRWSFPAYGLLIDFFMDRSRQVP